MLKATPRKTGTRQSKKLRLQGKIPASVQGEGKPNVDVAIDEHEFLTARRHHEHLFDVDVEGGQQETVLVNELQWDVTVERILHVEFRRVVRGQKTEVEVEVTFEGHPKGGVTNQLVDHVTVLSLPSQIPDGLAYNMDEREPGDTVTAGDLELPDDVDLALDPETPIATVTVPRGIEEIEEEEEALAEEAEAAEAEAEPAAEGEAPAEGESEGGEEEPKASE